jgi:general secretion pathway protein A
MIIDEAQNLSPAVLEQVRLLTNLETDDRKLLRIILIGQPELAELLGRRELRQLEQRITARYHLGTLNRPETYAYVMHRMSRAGGNPQAFSRSALRRIYALSRGTPRIINVIADRALLGAFTEGKHRVTGGIVNRAAREVLGRPARKRRWWLAAGAAVTVAGAAWALLGPLPLPGLSTARSTQPAAAPPVEAPAQPTPAPEGSGPSVAGPVLRREAPTLPGPAEPPAEQAPEVITPATYGELDARRQSTASSGELAPGEIIVTGRVGRPDGSAFANHRRAYGAVFDSWGVDFSGVSSEQIPCDFAPTAGLQCLSRRGDWSELARLDLPVVLELWDDQSTPYYAARLARAPGAETITLQVGAQRLQTSRAALRDSWAGAYVVLWQTPPSYYGNLREGQTHETVGWLRAQLAALLGQPLETTLPNYFDEDLERAVVEFQRSEGLLTDGIVGPATWIRLAARLRLPQPKLAG